MTAVNFPEAREELVLTLQAVHAWAHAHFTYVPDEERWPKGTPGTTFDGDHWEMDAELIADIEQRGSVEGDCDAFAKLCWMALRRLSLPSRLVAGNTEKGEGHLVCECQGWVLDNRQSEIVARQDLERLGYRFWSMSGFQPGEDWHNVARDA